MTGKGPLHPGGEQGGEEVTAEARMGRDGQADTPIIPGSLRSWQVA